MSTEISAAKAALRGQIRAARAGRNCADAGFAAQLAALISSANTVAGYIGYSDEPRINASLIEALANRKQVLLPRLRDDLDLEWGRWHGEPLSLQDKLAQPLSGTIEAIADADLILVPALAVDLHGNRLGQGGGSYDRALSRAVGKIFAVVYDEEVLNSLPSDSHDIKVSGVVTPTRTLTF